MRETSVHTLRQHQTLLQVLETFRARSSASSKPHFSQPIPSGERAAPTCSPSTTRETLDNVSGRLRPILQCRRPSPCHPRRLLAEPTDPLPVDGPANPPDRSALSANPRRHEEGCCVED